MIEFGNNLKQFRIEHHISQDELASILGYHQTTIGKWEKGIRKPPYETLLKIAVLFKTSVDKLLGRY